MSTEAIT
jgi:hypothetical protein